MTDREKLIELLCEVADKAVTIPTDGFIAYLADFLIANGVRLELKTSDKTSDSKWISVEERLPEPEQIVQVCCRTSLCHIQYLCHAYYIPEKWLAGKSDYRWEYESCHEYDEEADDYIVDSGWYERIYNWDDYRSVSIADEVTHWMPLPQPPREE